MIFVIYQAHCFCTCRLSASIQIKLSRFRKYWFIQRGASRPGPFQTAGRATPCPGLRPAAGALVGVNGSSSGPGPVVRAGASTCRRRGRTMRPSPASLMPMRPRSCGCGPALSRVVGVVPRAPGLIDEATSTGPSGINSGSSQGATEICPLVGLSLRDGQCPYGRHGVPEAYGGPKCMYSIAVVPAAENFIKK
jgi:hypothetical protein